jgi:exonuclease SbcD
MKLLHTSDWHLGHTLLDADREVEHDEFLSWLLDTIEAHEVDALLVTGDIFDSANPPATAQRAWYRFLVEAGRRRKGLQVVAIAGNHDSAARLEAPREVLASLDVTVVGELPCADGRLDPARLLVPLRDREGVRRAWVAAVPYLRSSDLAGFGEEAALEDDGSVRIDPRDASLRSTPRLPPSSGAGGPTARRSS